MLVAGRHFSEEIIERIGKTVRKSAELTRCGLSRLVCDWLDWKGADGRAKESSCRAALLKLERRGVIELPPARPVSFEAREAREAEPVWLQLRTTLSKLSGIKLLVVNGDKALSRLWRAMMKAHHPLGDGPLCGAQLRYLIVSDQGYLGGMSFSSAAWRLAERDKWIGWSEATRAARLSKIVLQSRFLVLPSVVVPHLASHVLSLAMKQLGKDWLVRYGEKPALVETFVDGERYKGTCYRARSVQETGRRFAEMQSCAAHHMGQRLLVDMIVHHVTNVSIDEFVADDVRRLGKPPSAGDHRVSERRKSSSQRALGRSADSFY